MLGVERVEVLIKSFFGGFPGVDCTSDSAGHLKPPFCDETTWWAYRPAEPPQPTQRIGARPTGSRDFSGDGGKRHIPLPAHQEAAVDRFDGPGAPLPFPDQFGARAQLGANGRPRRTASGDAVEILEGSNLRAPERLALQFKGERAAQERQREVLRGRCPDHLAPTVEQGGAICGFERSESFRQAFQCNRLLGRAH